MTAEMFQRSALDGRESDLARIGAREVPFLAQLSVRTRTSEAFGLPAEPNTWSSLDEATDALWLGPDDWLVVSSASRGAVDAAFGDAASLVDVSANRVLIDLRRDDAYDPRDLLEQGCSLDLDPRAWNEGMCAQTLLAHVPVILQERETGTRMFVRPSFANWLVDWLLAVSS